MSQRERLGLKDLVSLRKDLMKADISLVAPEEVHTKVPVPVPTDLPQEHVPQPGDSAIPKVLLNRKEQRRLVSQSFKLPADLDDRWARVAAFNRVTKTAILLEALETFLERLPHPPPDAA